MSAAEKLEELYGRFYDEAPAPLVAAQDMRRALPEIIAVVKAAEFARNWPEMPSDLRWEDFDAALSALDEKLGDVT